MIKKSIILAKIKRSEISFSSTIIIDDFELVSKNEKLLQFFLNQSEELILYSPSTLELKHSWLLTTERLILKNVSLRSLMLDEIEGVNIDHISEINKQRENIIYLRSKSENIPFFCETGSWHLFTEIFSWIISIAKANQVQIKEKDC